MIEGLDPKLKAKWDKKLREVGLPARIKKTEIPVPPSPRSEVLATLDLDVELSLKEFATLPDEIQDDILIDLKRQKELKMPPREILNRFDVLVAKGQELDGMTVESSDKNHEPKLSPEELKRREEDETVTRNVNELIRRIEWSRRRDNSEPKGADKYKN